MQLEAIKTCSQCSTDKPATSEFFYSNGKAGYLKSRCKKCDNARRLEASKVERKTGKFKERDAMYNQKYKEKRSESWKKYYEKNKVELIKKSVENYLRKYKEDELFRLKSKMRVFIGSSISRRGCKKSKKSEEILGISIEKFIEHIENQFVDGMTWENRDLWHIDHIIPLATADNEADVIRLNHYTNLRPLWATDNLKKGAKLNYIH